jgi:hypothetical protein
MKNFSETSCMRVIGKKITINVDVPPASNRSLSVAMLNQVFFRMLIESSLSMSMDAELLLNKRPNRGCQHDWLPPLR